MIRLFVAFIVCVTAWSAFISCAHADTIFAVASYFTGKHGLASWSASSPSDFYVIRGSGAILLHFNGHGFSQSTAIPPKREAIVALRKSVNDELMQQILITKKQAVGTYVKTGKTQAHGYDVTRYAVLRAPGTILASGIYISKGACKWRAGSKYLAAVKMQIFSQNGRKYLGVISYAVAADGDSPAIMVFRLPECQIK